MQSTPRNSNGSAKRHHSLSAPHSVKSQRYGALGNNTITPQLGKRKRGSSHTVPAADNGDEDELSPDREENIRSVEMSRRVVRAVLPVREEPNEAPDELSILEEAPPTARSQVNMTSLANGVDPTNSYRNVSRRSKSTDVVPVTPGVQPQSSSRHSFVLSTTVENTASNASQADDEDADELSPSNINDVTPKVISRESIPNDIPREGEEGDIDELSPTQVTSSATIVSVVRGAHSETAATPVPMRSIAHGRPHRTAQARQVDTLVTPVARNPGQRRRKNALVEGREDDKRESELSPGVEQTIQSTSELARVREEGVQELEGKSGVYEEEAEPEPEEETREPTPRPIAKRISPNQNLRTKSSNKPSRKRQKSLGPKLAISVMRMKGYGVRGITVADTTRTLLEEAIDHRLSTMLEHMQASKDSARRRELRGEINLSLSFKESLNEKLLDLQDANDVLTTNLKKIKIFKRDNTELRKEILDLQNGRQEIALEHDDVQAEFEAEKAKVEARNTLSANMFDIEAAAHNGRRKARQEGRESEGPSLPLSMLLETVSRDVGSSGGGLLAHVKSFNGALERAAGWLEGRA